MYENAGHWHLTTSGKDTIDNSVTTSWHLPCNSGADGCDTTDWLRSTKDRGFAISSFPHNELGQDFRFNIRTLHQMGDGYARSVIRADADSNYSYFFYAVNKITITFPHHVGYVNDCWRLRNAGDKCTKDKVHQIIVDQSSVQTTIANNLQNGNDIGDGNYQFKAGFYILSKDLTELSFINVFDTLPFREIDRWYYCSLSFTSKNWIISI
jgi:hypothetical protein